VAVFNNSLSIQPVNASTAKASLKGSNVIEYIDAYQNTDVVQTKYSNKLKEDIILKKPGHPEKFEYKININDFLWEIDLDGNILLRQKEKNILKEMISTDGTIISNERMKQYYDEHPIIFKIPAPFLIDVNGEESDINQVEVLIQEDKLILEPNKDWLKNHDYPIILDPTIETIPRPVKEIAELRNYNSVTFLNNDESYTTKFHGGHINYKDENGVFRLIDTKFVEQGSGWEENQASYRLKAPLFANEWIEFEDMFENKNMLLKMKPVAENVKGKLAEEGDWREKMVVYENAFGELADLQLIAGNEAFYKLVKIKEKTNFLGDLYFDFEVELPNWAEVNIDNKIWDKKNKISSKNEIKIGNEEKGYSILKKFYAWDSAEKITNIEIEIFKDNGKIYFRKIIPKSFLDNATFPVFADYTSTYYSRWGDGYVGETNGNWNTGHDTTTGDEVNFVDSWAYAQTRENAGEWNFMRIFLPIYTGDLVDNASISAVTLDVYVSDKYDEDNDGQDYIRLVQTDQPSVDELTTSDFNNCGTTDNPTAGAADIDLSGVSDGVYLTFTLNATGRGWISKTGTTMLGLREGHDVTDNQIAVGARNRIKIQTANTAGTNQDPYLSITYTGDDNPEVESVSDTPDPTTAGNEVAFTVDWNDYFGSENVKVKICKTNSLTNQNCDGGFWASSSAFTATDPTTTRYTTQAEDAGKNNYWAFVCDDSGLCSTSKYGSFTLPTTVGAKSLHLKSGKIMIKSGKMNIK
jgi:hypothetical protein